LLGRDHAGEFDTTPGMSGKMHERSLAGLRLAATR
jgi:hypothetical protein